MTKASPMHNLPPDVEALIDLALLAPDQESEDFLDALVDAERAGELTREQAVTLGCILGRSRAQEIARAFLGGP